MKKEGYLTHVTFSKSRNSLKRLHPKLALPCWQKKLNRCATITGYGWRKITRYLLSQLLLSLTSFAKLAGYGNLLLGKLAKAPIKASTWTNMIFTTITC